MDYVLLARSVHGTLVCKNYEMIIYGDSTRMMVGIYIRASYHSRYSVIDHKVFVQTAEPLRQQHQSTSTMPAWSHYAAVFS